MDPQWNSALVFALIFLIPMIPAAFFFSVLKSEAILTGPLRGFDAKFGGAFAAYFGTALLAVSTYPMWKLQPPPTVHQVWTIDGTLLDEQGQPIRLLNEGDVRLDPSPILRDNGHFTITATAEPTDGQYPHINIRHDDLYGPTIDLDPKAHDPNEASRDSKTMHIKLKAIRLLVPPPYSPTEVAAPTTGAIK